jgi:TonB family protein
VGVLVAAGIASVVNDREAERNVPIAPIHPAPLIDTPAVPTPSPTVPATHAAPGKTASTKPSAPAAKGAPSEGPRSAGSRLSSVVSQLSHEIREGSPDGDPLGESTAAEGDQYLASVVRALRQSYRLPATIPERERQALSGSLILHVAQDGRITAFEFTRRSGNPVFDEALERAVRQTRLPPPPAAQRETYQKGVEVDFRI